MERLEIIISLRVVDGTICGGEARILLRAISTVAFPALLEPYSEVEKKKNGDVSLKAATTLQHAVSVQNQFRCMASKCILFDSIRLVGEGE